METTYFSSVSSEAVHPFEGTSQRSKLGLIQPNRSPIRGEAERRHDVL
jgi:hypothetical protein